MRMVKPWQSDYQKNSESKAGKGGFWAKLLEGFGVEVSAGTEQDIEYDWVFLKNERMDIEEVKTSTVSITSTSRTVASSASTVMTSPPFTYYDYCPNCQAMIPKGSKFCLECGNQISEE